MTKFEALRDAGEIAAQVYKARTWGNRKMSREGARDYDEACTRLARAAIDYVADLARLLVDAPLDERTTEVLAHLTATLAEPDPVENATTRPTPRYCASCGVSLAVAGGCARCQDLKAPGVARSLPSKPAPRLTRATEVLSFLERSGACAQVSSDEHAVAIACYRATHDDDGEPIG